MTPSTLTVTEFLTARLDEDEAAARAAAEAPWVTMAWPAGAQVLVDPKAIRDEKWKYGKLGHVAMTEHAEYADHVARHDPARVLAQCAAMRKIVESVDPAQIEFWMAQDLGMAGPLLETWQIRTLQALASIWSDHPDWCEEWR